MDELQRIDSGQQLCGACMEALREATQRHADGPDAPRPAFASGSGNHD
jgi:hypothetical protein